MAARDGGGKGPAPDGGPVLRLGSFLNRGLRGLVRRRPGGGTARFDPSGTVRFDGGEEGSRLILLLPLRMIAPQAMPDLR